MTKDLISEVERCLRSLEAYRDSFDVLKGQTAREVGKYTFQPSLDQNPAHAKAMRATLDLTRMLAAWRGLPTNRYQAK